MEQPLAQKMHRSFLFKYFIMNTPSHNSMFTKNGYIVIPIYPIFSQIKKIIKKSSCNNNMKRLFNSDDSLMENDGMMEW